MDPLESHLLGQRSGPVSFWHAVRASVVLERVKPDRPVVLADLGAGAGLLGEILRRDRPRAIYRFYEPLDSLADVLEARFAEGARLPDVDAVEEADVVALLDVIEHVEDDHDLLSRVVAGMRPGATLVVTVPALPVLWSSWDEELGHHRRYTRRTLTTTASDLPVDFVEVSYLFPELIPPALVRRVIGGRLGGGSERQVSDFPELPPKLDATLRSISGATARRRRWWPVGTSLVLVGRRR